MLIFDFKETTLGIGYQEKSTQSNFSEMLGGYGILDAQISNKVSDAQTEYVAHMMISIYVLLYNRKILLLSTSYFILWQQISCGLPLVHSLKHLVEGHQEI